MTVSEKMEKQAAASIKAKAWKIDLPLRDEECAELAKAALTAALSDQVVVPKEPTQEMIEAGATCDLSEVGNFASEARIIYRAMIAAAPASTSGEVK